MNALEQLKRCAKYQHEEIDAPEIPRAPEDPYIAMGPSLPPVEMGNGEVVICECDPPADYYPGADV